MKYTNILTALILGVFLISGVSAFAVSSQYWDDNPVSMNPGETKEITILLQNMAGTVLDLILIQNPSHQRSILSIQIHQLKVRLNVDYKKILKTFFTA